MNIPVGGLEYSIGSEQVKGRGYSWTSLELNSALSGPIAEIVFDDAGKAEVEPLLLGVAETDFQKDEVERILGNGKPPEDWRVGEALAEGYLVNNRKCFFPWPDGRDERKSGSSLPGADLVGFQFDDGDDYFAFGEVKTSSESKYPPGAMYGRTGLKQQLEDIKDSEEIKDDLLIYLAYRAANAPWKKRWQRAAGNYLQNKNSIRVFGFLVRDVPPHPDDLQVRVEKLSQNRRTGMKIELLAVYLPPDSISSLSEKVVNSRSGGAG
ncbi:conserved hypothetical protein [Desulfatibacillum aliphaticivorans]|uniref:Anti-bacteriophage protein A/HamA C-terminal domain-containing protein n=1 Tax=Desulfatibacillum aliphaticivorans TaxID=218208 RepID=B8FJX2_DESAL|nr:hypothetical protein [Desulfatibacillum aliphaticivorans]ACL02400.1 conserved hypothetical protein [Desulfatibacillum aliphaticivorans]